MAKKVVAQRVASGEAKAASRANYAKLPEKQKKNMGERTRYHGDPEYAQRKDKEEAAKAARKN